MLEYIAVRNDHTDAWQSNPSTNIREVVLQAPMIYISYHLHAVLFYVYFAVLQYISPILWMVKVKSMGNKNLKPFYRAVLYI